MSNSWKVLVEDQVRYDSFTGAKTEQKEIWIKPENGEHVALICGAYSSISLEERMANAHLMAAAKDMYEALEEIMEIIRESFADHDGGSGHTTIFQCPLCGNKYEHDGDCVVPKVESALRKARGEQPNKEGENGKDKSE